MAKPAKDWDKIVRDFEEEEKSESSADDMLKKIYEGGSDETKRAMIKSFTESCGTVLSTNWDEIGKKKTKVVPPDGACLRKWEK